MYYPTQTNRGNQIALHHFGGRPSAYLSNQPLQYGQPRAIAPINREGIEMVKKDTFDMIFLDVHMPVMRGPEALKIIKQIRPEQIVIIFSSSSDPNYVFETDAEKNGAFECIYKPFNINDILSVIEKVLGEKLNQ